MLEGLWFFVQVFLVLTGLSIITAVFRWLGHRITGGPPDTTPPFP